MHSVILPAQFVGQEFKQCSYQFQNRVIKENDKVSNDFFGKSNEYIGQDCIGRRLDLSSIIDRPDGYLQGRLSDAEDVDYYKFDTLWYKGLSMVDKYNLDITVTLDNIPPGCDYDLILYDEQGNQVGIGKDNGKGGKSVSVPSWNMNNKGYTVKVQAKDSSPIDENKDYHLSFQTQPSSKNHGAYKQMQETQEYMSSLRKKLYEGQDTTEEEQALEAIREKYDVYYMEQMNELHEEQAKEYLQDKTSCSGSQMEELLNKMANGEALTEQEKGLIVIYATAEEYDSATVSATLKSTLQEELFSEMEKLGINASGYSFTIQIGANAQAMVEGIEDKKVKTLIEDIINKNFSGKLIDTYIAMNPEMQHLSEQERELQKLGLEIEKFLYKSTNGKVSIKDIKIENGKMKGLPENLDMLINQPGQNQRFIDYRADILSIKNYERMQNKKILAEFSANFVVHESTIQLEWTVSK